MKEKIKTFYNSGFSVKEVSEKTGCSISAIYKTLRELGIKPEYRHHPNRKINKEKIKLRAMGIENALSSIPTKKIVHYYLSGVSLKGIANKYSCSQKYIIKRLQDAGFHEKIKNYYLSPRHEDIINMYMSGRSTAIIAKKYKCPINLIKSILLKNNAKSGKLNDKNITEILNLRSRGYSIKNIAKRFGVRYQAVRYRILKYTNRINVRPNPNGE